MPVQHETFTQFLTHQLEEHKRKHRRLTTRNRELRHQIQQLEHQLRMYRQLAIKGAVEEGKRRGWLG